MLTFDNRQTVVEYDSSVAHEIAISCDGSLLMFTDMYSINIYDRREEITTPFIYTSPVIFFMT